MVVKCKKVKKKKMNIINIILPAHKTVMAGISFILLCTDTHDDID